MMTQPTRRQTTLGLANRRACAERQTTRNPLPGKQQLAVGCLLLAIAAGCGSKPNATDNGAPADDAAARTRLERGPVTVTVEVTPAPARLSDEPILTVTVDHEQGVDVRMPPFGEAVGEFLVRDFHEPLAEIRDQRQIERQVYTLEPTRTGQLIIEPVTITFTDNRAAGDGKEHSVETEPLSVEVVSMVESEAPSLDDLQGFSDPVALPASPSWWIWWLLGATAVVIGSGLVFWKAFRGRRQRVETPLTPRELAQQALDHIWHEQLFRQDVKRFYAELTGIVRQYIERTSGVRAPEQTTEEFLREISTGNLFELDERQRLRDFLESADLVKFAAYRPGDTDIGEAYRRARLFVGCTTEYSEAAGAENPSQGAKP